ncbi:MULTISPECIES: two-component regulator propeller domain-containing protein [Bacteroides]|jgi:signal transduction histidine kinase/DNA-binding response OmpR family regulator/ligand-binding sensor domain-containing protein|uniref:histidine kinase n=1 Tax=Bacteroides ovatus TaxID=28116 RepID=A0A1G8R412_BACOV|nr:MULTISPECIES: two-component regulator propeller domain-containing protein [Bacteroides]SDJ11697.1 Signal transduction histidine kinase [Bacteroides ovatus]
MRTRTFILLCITFIIQFAGVFPLQAGHYYYKQISLKDGLPSTVRCILTDEQGFVWIGTRSGLGRYDGHELKKYIHQADHPHSLPHNLINQITEDKQNNIWILTDKGVACYQRQSDDFFIPTDEKGNNILAYSTCLMKDGVLFGSQNKVYFYNYQNSSLRLLQTFNQEPNFNITLLSLWNAHTLLCCSRWQGLLLLDLNTGKHSPPPFDCGKEIMNMLIDSQNRIWIAPYNEGIRCFTPDGKQLASYTTHNSNLNNNVVLSLAEREGKIWIGTDGGGINILEPETGRFSLLEHVPGSDNYSLPANSILCLYNDRNNNIWAGSIRNGLISIREVSMKTYTDVLPGSDRGLSNNTVLSLYQEADDRIWIGTDGGGLNLFNPLTEKFTHFPSTWEDKVASICPFTSGNLLLSIFSQGVFVFNPSTGKKTPFIIIDSETSTRLGSRGKTVNLFQNTPHSVLLLGDHVYQYHLKEQTFSIATEQQGADIIGAILPVTNYQNYTYLNDTKHIFRLDNHTNRLEVLYQCSGDTLLNSVSRDEYGNFWIGNNYGLTHYHPATQEQTPMPTSLFGEVTQIVCDQQGKVWIGTDNMLFAWLIKEKKFVLFGESDGVIQNEYLSKPRLLSSQGNIYMGGVKGLLHINSNLPLITSEFPQLQLSDVIINGESVNDKLSGTPVGISAPWNSNITIRIMSKEKDIFRQKVYRYQIEGLNDQQIESYNPELAIRSLPPGSYKIMASCTAKDGSWIPSQEVLELTILPPWYRTWWFILCCAIFIAAIIVETFRRTLKRKEEKLKWAMKEHEQQVYEEKVRFLINISHELRTPLTLIHAPLSRILKSLSAEDTQYLPIKAIYRQSQRMKNLINMVLDVRKMEVGESKLQIQPYALNQWIEHVSQDFISEGGAKNVRIRYQLDPHIDTVSFDKDKCEIILSNLLINALKHSPQDAEIIIMSELLSEENSVRISIIDRGNGLKQVNTQKLFTRFYQGTGEQSGTGIGLSYSKILVELHGGSISAQDNQDAGATFFFELPLRQQSEEIICHPKAYLNELMSDDNKEQQPEEDNFDTSPYSVLVVDDNPDLTDFLKKSLGEYFKRVVIASDGMEALQLTKSHVPDIIVSDVMMPRMNGYELCKNIKEDITISHIPIVLLTARDDKQSQLSGYKNGADAYLTKPFEIEMLMEIVRNRLKNRESIKKRYLNAGLVPAPEESTFSLADETFLLKLNKIIQENLDNSNLDVTLICKEIGMSRASLYNKLKALTDMGANDYINKFRMEKAITLITHTDMSFTEITEKIGFTTSRYFSTAFKQYTGETPTQYKERQKRERKE